MPVNRAAIGFHNRSSEYEHARPGYPEPAVRFLTRQLGLGPRVRLLDLGAGTGKLTRMLLASGVRPIGLEPMEGMRRQFTGVLPGCPLVAAVAEAIPLAAGSIDAICAGQAFHWFANPRALGEIKRVLRKDGRLGLIWNSRPRGGRGEGWQAEMWGLVDRYEPAQPGYDRGWKRALDEFGGWREVAAQSFANAQSVSLDQILQRVASTSFIAGLPDDEHAKLLARVRTLVSSHPPTLGSDHYELLYHTETFVYEA